MEMNKQVIDNMDEWANRLNEKVFQKEVIGIPETVVALAAIRLLAHCVRNSTVLTEAAALKLVEGELGQEQEFSWLQSNQAQA